MNRAMAMKVAHLVRRFVPEEWGGTEAVVYQLCDRMVKRGVESPIFTTDMLSRPGSQVWNGLDIRRFPYCFPWWGLSTEERRALALKGGNPLSLSLLRHLMKEPDLSLVHLHVQNRLGGIGRTVARLKGIPYLVTIHGGHFTLSEEQAEQMARPSRGKWEWGKVFGALLGSRRVLDDAAAIVCVGQDEHQAMARRFPHKQVTYIPNGVDPSFFRGASGEPFRSRLGLNPSDKVVLCLSRIDPQKNQLALLEAFIPFSQRFPDYRLVLVGPATVPDYLTQLKAKATDKVFIVPAIAPGDPLLASAYRSATLFVLPSLMEPFGMVILEAWASGVPVIASKVGGIPGFTTHKKNVWHAQPTPQSLLEAMTHLASAPSTRQQIAEEGLKEVEKYTWERVLEQYWRLYQSLC